MLALQLTSAGVIASLALSHAGHRFSGYDPALERIELKEEIETGALHGMMQSHPAPDDAGIIWTAWEELDQD